jgi:hypothetical protein
MKPLPRLAPFALALFLAMPSWAQWKVTGQAPKFDILSGTPEDTFNNLFQNEVIKDIQDQLKDINSSPEKLVRGFANASTYTSTSASQRGYLDYRVAAFTIGPMAGVQLPAEPWRMEEYADSSDTGDISAGANIQAITAQAGINTGILPFMPFKGLYAALKFGAFNYDTGDDYRFKTVSLGLLANYQLVRGIKVPAFQWRGISVGAGFVWQRSEIQIEYALNENSYIWDVDSDGDDDFVVSYRSTVLLNMTGNTFVVPLEVSTAVRLLGFLNITAALGCDIAFGSNKLAVSANTKMDFTPIPSGSYYGAMLTDSGWLKVEGGGSMAPNIANPRLSGGIGFTLGSVVLDIPVNWYFAYKGWSAGVTLGFVW